MFDVNVHGTMNGTWAALEVLRRRDAGHVVNVISLAGLAAPPGETVYAATKHAALAFTTGTLQDLHGAGVRGVQLSAVCPDGIWTPMLHDKVDDPCAAPSWSGVMLQPEQVAAVVVDAWHVVAAAAAEQGCGDQRGGGHRQVAGAGSHGVQGVLRRAALPGQRQGGHGERGQPGDGHHPPQRRGVEPLPEDARPHRDEHAEGDQAGGHERPRRAG